MSAKASSLRRKLFVALLVLMTLLPLVVYVYARSRGRQEATQRLAEYLKETVTRALRMRSELEPVIESSGEGSQAVRNALEAMVARDDSFAYLQLADQAHRVVNGTSSAPARDEIRIRDLPLASTELEPADVMRHTEYIVDLHLSKQQPGYLALGISTKALERRLSLFQDPVLWSSLQIAVICVGILAVFSAYILYLNERARLLHAQLQEESRLAYIGTLAAGIAHEVRNPLSSVKLNVQMMENRLREMVDREQAEYFRVKVERIKGEVDRLEDSISHFLTFARPVPLRLERVRLNDVVDNVLELLQPQCQSRGIQLVRRYGRDLPPVALDSRQFAQAVQNLVINAVQALDRGGTITVATEATQEGVALAVADDGPGIPKEIHDKIFEVFFTTREGGTGLGLNIVSRIAEEHRGRLSVQSEPGKGATFRIELPIADSRSEGQESA
jgi:signal transduction histidine kinase